MKNNSLKKIVYTLIVFIQVALIIAVFIVQDLTSKKAGVMRHIYTRRYQLEESIFTSYNLNILSTLSILLSFILIFLILYNIKNNKSKFYIIQLIISLLISIMVFLVIKLNYFVNMMAYQYFIMVFLVVLFLQAIILLFAKNLYN